MIGSGGLRPVPHECAGTKRDGRGRSSCGGSGDLCGAVGHAESDEPFQYTAEEARSDKAAGERIIEDEGNLSAGGRAAGI